MSSGLTYQCPIRPGHGHVFDMSLIVSHMPLTVSHYLIVPLPMKNGKKSYYYTKYVEQSYSQYPKCVCRNFAEK